MRSHSLQGTSRFLAMTAMLAALATVLEMLGFPLPFLMPSFIKLDFSDLPALIASFSMGPLHGMTVCFIKNLIHLFSTTTGGVGEFSNFVLSSSFVVTAGLVYRTHRNRRGALVGALLGALAMALLSFPSNYFVVYPIYYRFMPEDAILGAYQAIVPFVDSIPKALLLFNIPFTFLKGVLNTLLAFLVYKRISPFIQGKKTEK